ncbi:MAG: hypothetical protein RLZZ605_592 [Bacteroidota bacterium]|jgi:hypothetical protein
MNILNLILNIMTQEEINEIEVNDWQYVRG